MKNKRRLLIDTDTASDDAVALVMALRADQIEVLGITVVAGNVPVEQATRNALFTTELCGADVPVFSGAAHPLVRKLETADWFHGSDGLGDHGYAPARRMPEPEHAVDAMIRIIRANPGIEVITLGPLTNFAKALRQDTGLVGNISRCVVMGGAPCCEGNVTPAAEFNIWVDPEAAAVVFRSGAAIEMVGWQLSRGAAVISNSDEAAITRLDTPFADFAIRSNSVATEAYLKQTGERGICLPDPIAMAILLDPALCRRCSEYFVEIETSSPLTRGMTVVDVLNVSDDERNRDVWADTLLQARKASICWELNIEGWKAALVRALS